ncbi:MAG: protein kinase [Ignavibacteriales bacterium]|nr:protein kinase [Ignavibacteriales bacterium]
MEQKLSQYIYDENSLLGEGGFARVYRARDTVGNTDVALKVLKTEFEDHAAVLESFFQDAQLVRKCNHENIIRIHEVGPTQRPYFFSMEFCGGGDLRRMIHTRRRLPVRTVLGYAIPLCDALGYCHKTELFHRDIKASNILFRDSDTPMLSDFGNAVKEYDGASAPGLNIGSPPYVSPEVWEEDEYNASSDLYSFGVLMYYALTGMFPFPGKSVEEYKKMHLFVSPSAPSKWRPSVIKQLDEVVLSLLEKDRQNRVSSALELKEALMNIRNQFYEEPDAPHRSQLVLCMDKENNSGVTITNFPFRIGKLDTPEGDQKNDFVINTEDPFVSRFHAVIEQVEDGFLFTDVSTNGSFVNGSYIHKQSIELIKENIVVLGENTSLFLRFMRDREEQLEQSTRIILPEEKKGMLSRFKHSVWSVVGAISIAAVALLLTLLLSNG